MTQALYCDSEPQNTPKTLDLGIQSSRDALLVAGIRARPVDLALAFGVSKQCVSGWVKTGRVVLGADGRVDPRFALKTLLATGDPARLRARFLAPLLSDLHAARQRVAAIEAELARQREDAEFYESASSELSGLLDVLRLTLESEWTAVRELPPEQGLAALLAWLEEAQERGVPTGFGIMAMAARQATEQEGPDLKTEEEKDFEL